MAIKNRRGSYSSFAGGTALEDGEIGVVMSGDPNTTDGTGVYIDCGGDVIHRILTDDDKTDLEGDIQTNADAITALNTALTNINSGYGGDLSLPVVSVASGTWTDVYSHSFAPGKYLVICGVAFDTNATGVRACDFALSTAGSNHGRLSPMIQASVSQTRMQVVRLANFTTTVSYSLWAYQNSGSNVNVYPSIAFIKLV